jgi:hypothetical protein
VSDPERNDLDEPCPGCAGQPVVLSDPRLCYWCWDRERERPVHTDKARLVGVTPVTLKRKSVA